MVAVQKSIVAIPEPALRRRVESLVEATRAVLHSARTINFVGYEQRELEEHSLELWNEVAPMFSKVFKDLHALVDTITGLFPKKKDKAPAASDGDFDLAFDLLQEGEAHPVTGQNVIQTGEEKVTELVHSYAWVIKQSVQEEMKKLREPALMQQQWNLLGELEVFRDKSMGAMHAMVVGVLNVFDDVDVETIFPAAYEMTEMGVAVRRHVAELATHAETALQQLTPAATPELVKAILLDMDERTAQLLKLPSIGSLRASDRHELASFRRQAAQMRNGSPNRTAVRQLLDGHSKFLSSLQSVELRERLGAHDKDVAQEALAAVAGALRAGPGNPGQAMTFVAHAARRLGRLYGVNPELDACARQLRDAAAAGLQWETVLPVLGRMEGALKGLAG